MPPTIHFVRHAQAAHNAALDATMRDANLTPQGEVQCQDLRAAFPHHAQVVRVLSSPLQRAMTTALLTFARDEIGPVVALDTLQETSDAPSSTGADVATLRERYSAAAVDLSRVREGWNDKSRESMFAEEWDKLVDRTREARRVIREIAGEGDDHVAVVAHGAVLHFLTEDWQGMVPERPSDWANCEYRSYQFVDSTGKDDNATLRETDGSWKRRKGNEPRPTDAQQLQMRDPMQKAFEAAVLNGGWFF